MGQVGKLQVPLSLESSVPNSTTALEELSMNAALTIRSTFTHRIFIFMFAFLTLIWGGIAVAEDSKTDGAATKNAATADLSDRKKETKHNFNYELDYSMREEQNPIRESWHTGISGGLLGLGTGISIYLIGSAFEVEPKSAGNIIAGLTGTGFLAGAVYGYIRSNSYNDELRKERQQVFEKYGHNPNDAQKTIMTPVLMRSSTGLA